MPAQRSNDADRATLLVERALQSGKSAFGDDWRPELLARAPGRIELLGNHLDYNGGPVLAAAIDRDLVCLSSAFPKGDVEAVFGDVAREIVRVDADEPSTADGPAVPPGGVDYVRGAIEAGQAADAWRGSGRRLSIAGDVPLAFGLSSSAALCVALCLSLHEPTPEGRTLVLRAQDAEHRAGTPCGTMDQSASVAGGVIRFDGRTTTFERLQPNLGDWRFAVIDSGIHRSLATSSYGVRVEEGQAILSFARSHGLDEIDVVAAIDRTREEELIREGLPNPLTHRLRHIVSETERVQAGLVAMSEGDWKAFGELMNASGRSSAVDYEISHPLVEALVTEANAVEGVLGARMMGGGEGGAALVLLHVGAVAALRQRLTTFTFPDHATRGTADRLVVCAFGEGAELRHWAENGRSSARIGLPVAQ